MMFLGANLIPEGLELGEMKINAVASLDELSPIYIIAYSGDQINTGDTPIDVGQNGYEYNGIYSSVTYIVTNEYGFSTIMALLNQSDNSNHILTVFSVPKLAVKSLLPVDPPRNSHLFL